MFPSSCIFKVYGSFNLGLKIISEFGRYKHI